MITLCGFPLSNYYNKVKLVLLEKNVPFVEERVATKDPAMFADSPLGKVPFIRTEHGPLCESQVIVDYLEARYPEPALMPSDLWAQAKVRELVTFVELYLELIARELYPQAFFGQPANPENVARVLPILTRNIAAFKTLASFDPYVGGSEFTLADCSAYVNLPLVGLASKIAGGTDLLEAGGIDWRSYTKRIEQRPSAQKVVADRKADGRT